MIKETAVRSIAWFILAGLCEIGGGWMIWKSLRENNSIWTAMLGGILLTVYGVVATFQTSGFGRAYAAYGGVFVILFLLWGWVVDKTKPDAFDITGAIIVMAGAAVIMYAPRN